MAKAKRGPGRPPKKLNKRGRKPGIKNRTFLEHVMIQSDAFENALNALSETLEGAHSEETRPGFVKVLEKAHGLVSGIMETIGDALGGLTVLPEDYAPGKAEPKKLAWVDGAFVTFKPAIRDIMNLPDAYQILEIIELGRGPGNGTMIRLEKGLFAKTQLELIDGDALEEATPTPSMRGAPAPKPRASAPKNGATSIAVALAPKPVVEESDDLNA